MVGLFLLGVVAVLLLAAALNDLHWRRQGFRTEVKGRGKHKVVLRIPLDGSAAAEEPVAEEFPPVRPGQEWRPRSAEPDADE